MSDFEETSFTYYFEEIFPTYQDWVDFMGENGIIDYSDPFNESFDQFCWNILSRHYTHTNIRYTTPEYFKAELMNVYENKFKQYQKQKAIIDETYELTLDEIQQLRNALTNMANNPNVENPLNSEGVLEYISAQTYQAENDNKLKSYIMALNNIPSLNMYKFLKADSKDEMGFDDLFMQVQPNILYYYKKEEE